MVHAKSSARVLSLICFSKSRLGLTSLLFFFALNLSFSSFADASCIDLLRPKPAAISVEAFTQAQQHSYSNQDLSQLSPEQILAAISQAAPNVDLLNLLKQEFKVDSLRLGSSFGVASWPYHVLTLKKLRGSGEKALAKYTIEFARFLFEEKRRQLRFVLRPDTYLASLERLTEQLEEIVYPALAILHPETLAESRQRWGAVRMSLRSLFMISPSTKQIWPLEGGTVDQRKSLNFRRQSLHWGISRTLAAVYISILASTLSHLPDHFESFKLLYQIRGDIIELGTDLGKGVPYDRKLEREKLISKYEERIQSLEKQIEADNGDSVKLKNLIKELRQAIVSMRAEISN